MEKGEKSAEPGLEEVRLPYPARRAFRLASGSAVSEMEIQHQEPPQHAGNRLLQSPISVHNHRIHAAYVIYVC